MPQLLRDAFIPEVPSPTSGQGEAAVLELQAGWPLVSQLPEAEGASASWQHPHSGSGGATNDDGRHRERLRPS